MLAELLVRDLALFERAELTFVPGLNVLTGETGAGKSLLIGALELLLGRRPRPGLLRSGASKALVEGRFQVPRRGGEDLARLERWLSRHLPGALEGWRELEAGDERELILSRTLEEGGRTRAYVDGRPVTRTLLAELAPRLFEIHGQNDHQKLLEPAEQLRLLDEFGGLEPQVRSYREARARWLALVQRAERLQQEGQARRDRLELARFQLAEIRAAAPEPDERARLAPEREMLRHAENLKGGLANLVEELFEAEGSLLERLQRAERFLTLWKGGVALLDGPAGSVSEAVVHLQEAARELRTLAEAMEVDPARLEELEGRLAELERLERKYGRKSSELAEHASDLEREILDLEAEEKSLEGIEAAVAVARSELLEHGGELRRARRNLRPRLVKAVQHCLKDLGLERADFDLKLGAREERPGVEGDGEPGRTGPGEEPSERGQGLRADLERFSERGLDRIEFLLAANPGEGVQKLRQVASGGEMARVMLALRSVLASATGGRMLVFDEIDANVGGRLGPVVGEHLKRLGEFHQVLCVTHLPAIAAAAARHVRVRKAVSGGRTSAAVEELSGDARVEEIADMIAGGSGQATALAEARRLLG